MLQILWADPRWPREPILDPTADDVRAAILALNGDDATEVAIEHLDDDTEELLVSLIVAGGAEGLCLISWRDVANDVAYDARCSDMQGDGAIVRMVSGGQEGAWRRELFVPLSRALGAADAFFAAADRDPNLLWVRV